MFVDRRSIITTLSRTADISSHFMHKLYFVFLMQLFLFCGQKLIVLLYNKTLME